MHSGQIGVFSELGLFEKRPGCQSFDELVSPGKVDGTGDRYALPLFLRGEGDENLVARDELHVGRVGHLFDC